MVECFLAIMVKIDKIVRDRMLLLIEIENIEKSETKLVLKMLNLCINGNNYIMLKRYKF